MGKILWLDTETTGTDPEKHGIVQIAGIVEIDGEVKEEFNFKVKPFAEDQIDFGAIEATGLDLREAIGYPEPAGILQHFVNLMEKYIDKFDKEDKFCPAGYNVAFDLNFIWQWCMKQDFKYFRSYVSHVKIDVMNHAHYLVGMGLMEQPESFSLTDVCALLEVELPDAHDALADIRATRALAYEINRRTRVLV